MKKIKFIYSIGTESIRLDDDAKKQKDEFDALYKRQSIKLKSNAPPRKRKNNRD